MSSRTVRKLQGNKGSLDLTFKPSEGSSGDDKENESSDVSLVPGNRFDLLVADSLSESEAKEDDDLTEAGEPHQADLVSKSTSNVTVRKRRRKKKRKGQAKISASSEDHMDQEIDEVESCIREVNAILGEASPVPNDATKSNSERSGRSLLTVEHRYLNPHNEMKKIFGSKVVQSLDTGRRRGGRRGTRPFRGTWIVQEQLDYGTKGKPGVSMVLVESSNEQQVFKYQHSLSYQQAQARFLRAVESLNPENIMDLLHVEPFHVDTLLQVSEFFRLGDDNATAAQLMERAIYILESSAHPLFNITTGTCRLSYRQQENRSLYIAIFHHIMNVASKGCYRTALELCKLLLSLSPDEDPLAVSLMLDFYALHAQEYAWLVSLYDAYEPTKNLSMLVNFAYSVPLALFFLSEREAESSEKCERNSKVLASFGTPDEMGRRADELLQHALLMFPSVLMLLLEKCNVQPTTEVSNHPFFGPSSQTNMSKGLALLVKLFVGRNYHDWKDPRALKWLEDNVNIVMARVDSCDPLVEKGEEQRRTKYQGTPLAIYRHILLAEVPDTSASLPPSLVNSSIMSFDPLPPPDSVCDYKLPEARQRSSGNESSILASFFQSLLPTYNPNAPEPEGAVGGVAEDEEGGRGDIRVSVNTLLEAMRGLMANIHLPEVRNRLEENADQSEDEHPEWD